HPGQAVAPQARQVRQLKQGSGGGIGHRLALAVTAEPESRRRLAGDARLSTTARRRKPGAAPAASGPARRLTRQSARLELRQVVAPQAVLLLAQPIEVVPRIDAAVVQVVEADPDGVGADRLDRHDADVAAAGDDLLLAGAVPLDLGRGALDPQQLGRQGEAAAVVEVDLQLLRAGEIADFARVVLDVELAHRPPLPVLAPGTAAGVSRPAAVPRPAA